MNVEKTQEENEMLLQSLGHAESVTSLFLSLNYTISPLYEIMCVCVFACDLQTTDHAVGEKDTDSKGDLFSFGFSDGPGGNPEDEG